MAARTATKSRLWQLCLLVVTVALFIFVLQGNGVDVHKILPGDNDSTRPPSPTCELDTAIPEKLGLTGPLSYARLYVDVKDNKWYHRASSNSAPKELGIAMPPLRELNAFDSTQKVFVANEHETCSNRTTIHLPAHSLEPADASNIFFGVATSLSRLSESLIPFAHWAGNTNTKILALVEKDTKSASAGDIAKVIRDAQDLGIDLNIARQNHSADSTDGDRYFALVKHLYEHQPEGEPEWVALIDDDTFFPSIGKLLETLDEYDALEQQYIGGMAEDLHQLQNYGFMAYGGGGAFLSMPLLAGVYDHFEECDATGHEGGDKRLAECIYKHTSTKLSWETGLHQMDLLGDPSGFYEADREQPLSIHHWKSWNTVDVVSMAALAPICGSECLLRRYEFLDGWTMVNGFSIFKYSAGYEKENDFVMEETWYNDGDWDATLAPLHPKDDGKISYRLEASASETDLVRQYYVRRKPGGDSVVEVVWRRS